MAAQRTSFGKMQRDRAKKAKAAMKREKRQAGPVEKTDEGPEIIDDGGELSAPVLLDLPDFNSIEEKNHVRAETSLERAEQVLFFATAVNYADRNVVGELERACRVAGNLAAWRLGLQGGVVAGTEASRLGHATGSDRRE